jgi:hypothetical protein
VEGTDIVGLTTTRDRRRVIGATVRGADGQPQPTTADLVVDATGRGSRTPIWLQEWGYQRPAEDRLDIGLGSATRTFRLRPRATSHDKFSVSVPRWTTHGWAA